MINGVSPNVETTMRKLTQCAVEALDRIFESDHPALIRIDIEDRHAADMEADGGLPSSARILADAGFAAYRVDPLSRRLEPLGQQSGGNVIFIRDRSAVEARIARAPRFALSQARSI